MQPAIFQFTITVSDLGVMVDSQLNMSTLVTAVDRSCTFQLRQLKVVKTFPIHEYGEDTSQCIHQQET